MSTVEEKFAQLAQLMNEIENEPGYTLGFQRSPVIAATDVLLGKIADDPEEDPELVSRIVFNPSDTRYLVDDHPRD